jgi:hypothetical protein
MSDEETSMTEAQWSASAQPYDLLEYVRIRTRGRSDPRRMRLFSCACVRAVWHLLTDDRSRRVVEVAEEYADGRATAEELGEASRGASAVAYAARKDPFKDAAWAATHVTGADAQAGMCACSAFGSASQALAKAATRKVAERDTHQANARAHQAALLRDIFGNPFRPVRVDSAWLTPAVAKLARRAYEGRSLPGGELNPKHLAALADKLAAAGASGELVDHLRGPGPHVRGCWAVDAALGRDVSVPEAEPAAATAPRPPVENPYAPCFGGPTESGTYSLAFTDFDGTASVFEEAGHEGGGYDWQGVVDALVRMRAPKLRRKLNYDPEGSMFAVWSKDADAIRQAAELIRAAVEDHDLLREAIRKADPDLMDS